MVQEEVLPGKLGYIAVPRLLKLLAKMARARSMPSDNEG